VAVKPGDRITTVIDSSAFTGSIDVSGPHVLTASQGRLPGCSRIAPFIDDRKVSDHAGHIVNPMFTVRPRPACPREGPSVARTASTTCVGVGGIEDRRRHGADHLARQLAIYFPPATALDLVTASALAMAQPLLKHSRGGLSWPVGRARHCARCAERSRVASTKEIAK
jgi:hypothetical protein